ncbi:MAG: HipA family kinase [Cyanobacteria bacterium J06639_16]
MGNAIPIYSALRVVSAQKLGSSRPILIETDAGYFLTKLRGAAQGTSALVAEVIVAALAEALGLWMPSRVLISIDTSLKIEDREDELRDLLVASHGINLGFQYLKGAKDIHANEIEAIDENLACQVLWLDSLVMNVDRTAWNPNLLRWRDKLWVIDHGASLPFQYNWSAVRESSPRSMKYAMDRHLFWDKVRNLDIWDRELTARLSTEVLQDVIAQIPDCFLQPLLPPAASAQKLERRRQAYAAFLWKRLKSPRPFMDLWLAHRLEQQIHESL